MKNKKLIKIVQNIAYVFCILQISLLISMSVVSLATTGGDELFSNMASSVGQWENMGTAQMNSVGINTDSLLKPVLSIAQVFTFVGFFAVVGATLLIAVRWLISTNKSPEGLEKVKRQTFGLVIAACILLGAYKIWAILLEGLDSIA